MKNLEFIQLGGFESNIIVYLTAFSWQRRCANGWKSGVTSHESVEFFGRLSQELAPGYKSYGVGNPQPIDSVSCILSPDSFFNPPLVSVFETILQYFYLQYLL